METSQVAAIIPAPGIVGGTDVVLVSGYVIHFANATPGQLETELYGRDAAACSLCGANGGFHQHGCPYANRDIDR